MNEIMEEPKDVISKVFDLMREGSDELPFNLNEFVFKTKSPEFNKTFRSYMLSKMNQAAEQALKEFSENHEELATKDILEAFYHTQKYDWGKDILANPEHRPESINTMVIYPNGDIKSEKFYLARDEPEPYLLSYSGTVRSTASHQKLPDSPCGQFCKKLLIISETSGEYNSKASVLAGHDILGRAIFYSVDVDKFIIPKGINVESYYFVLYFLETGVDKTKSLDSYYNLSEDNLRSNLESEQQ